MKFKLSCAAFASGVLTAATVSAHPGHSIEVVDADSPLHYVLQPEHSITLVAIAVVLVAAWVRFSYLRWQIRSQQA